MTTIAEPAWTATDTGRPGSLLGETAGWVRTVTPAYPDAYAIDPAAEPAAGWLTLDDAVPVLVGQATAALPGAVVPVRVAGALAHAVAGRMTAALVIGSRSPVLGPATAVVLADGEGGLARVATRSPTVALLAGDPAGAHPDALPMPDRAALLGWAARTVVGTLTPLFAELRARTRFGLVPMWTTVGDSVLSVATWLPYLAGRDQRAEREVGELLVDALAAAGAPIRRRGRVLCLTRARSAFLAPVDAGCCLYYRTQPDVQRAEASCVSCPHLSDDERGGRYLAYLDDHHPEPTTPDART